MIIISHRPSLLAICDRHFELAEGVLKPIQFKASNKDMKNCNPSANRAVNQ